MKFCISNLAWDPKDDPIIFNLIKKKINYLEYSPSLLIKNLRSEKEITKVKQIWKRRKIKLYSMQSILYNVNNSYIFGNKTQQKNFYNEVQKKIILAKKLNTKIIVFGSPKNKMIFGKKKKFLDKISFEMFKKISLISEKYKIIFCLEANPKIYGTEYLTHTTDAIKLAKKINSRYFKVNLDLGTIISNNENVNYLLKNYMKFFAHAQISSPGLKNLLKYKKKIKYFLKILSNYKYNKVVSIETLKKNRNNYQYIRNLLNLIK